MKKISLAIVAIIALSSFAFQTLWTQDKAHSELLFSVKHLGVSTVSGYFTDFDAKITSNKDDFSDASFELTAKTNSINTRIEMRDNHLKSADFFDVEKYPTVTFKSTSVTKGKKKTFLVSGNLTLLGVTKPVTLTVKHNGNVTNQQSGKETAGFDVEGTIKRSDFGFGSKFGEAMISDVVTIKASGEFTK
jgi:polyisoprenoid-binding protein YceI